MDDQINIIVDLIKQTPLDQTIKEILIRDLLKEGLTEFMKEQINAYCVEGIKQVNAKVEEAKKLLSQKDPA